MNFETNNDKFFSRMSKLDDEIFKNPVKTKKKKRTRESILNSVIKLH